jgi:hypothetical protein
MTAYTAFNRIDNFYIASAAAKIAGQGLADLLPIGFFLHPQQSIGGHQETRGTKPTLAGTRFGPGFLQRGQAFSIAQTFDGGYGSALDLGSQSQTCQLRLAVDLDRTTTASA